MHGTVDDSDATWRVASTRANFDGARRSQPPSIHQFSQRTPGPASSIVGDCLDDVFYDSARKRLYVTGGDTVNMDEAGNRRCP